MGVAKNRRRGAKSTRGSGNSCRRVPRALVSSPVMATNPLARAWGRVPAPIRSTTTTGLKVLLTIGAFYLLLTHRVRTDDGRHVSALRAIADYLPQIDPVVFWRFVAL